jgi:Flp pilus assembly protein TadD
VTLRLALAIALGLGATGAARAAPEDPEIWRAPLEILRRRVSESPGDAGLHLKLAFAYFAAGLRDRSADEAAAATALDPTLAARLPERVRDALEAGRPRDALVLAREWMRGAPGSCEATRVSASLEQAVGLGGEAERLLREAAARCPESARVIGDLARLLIAHGCDEEAERLLEDQVRAEGWDGATRASLAAALVTAREAVARRFAAIDREVSTLENDAAAPPARGAGREQIEARWRETHDRAERLARDEPASAAWELRLASVYRIGHALGVAGAHDRALDHVRRAIELRPVWPRAWTLLGTLELAAEPARPEAAERAFVEALGAAGGEPLAATWSGLFFTYVAEGRYAAASAAADAYLALVPGDADIAAFRDETRKRATR